MLGRWRRRTRGRLDDGGATAVEYGLIVGLIAVVVVPAIIALQLNSADAFVTTAEADPGVNVCGAGDPTCTAFDALPAANIPGMPAVVTLAATAIGATSAQLNGTVNANGTTTAARFCYGTSADLTGCTTVNGSPASVSGSATTVVSATLGTLATNTTYYFRVVGTSSKGTRYGTTLSFTTGTAGATAPTATTLAAGGLVGTSATLNGYIVAGGSTATVTFCYDTKSNLNGCTPVAATPTIATGTTGTNVSLNLTGLLANKKYYFRVQATNGLGSDTGNTLNFTTGTAAVAPTATTVAASLVTSSTATLNGTTAANGANKADVSFCWGPVAALNASCTNGTPVPVTTLNANQTSNQSVSTLLTGLAPGRTYYFQVVATNQGNGLQALGGVLPFATPSAAPTVTTQAATGIATTAATLNGSVSSNGATTTASFVRCDDAAMTTACVSRTAAQSPVAATGSGVAIAYAEAGLTAGKTYYFRAVGNNGTGGDQRGAVLSFTTTSLLPACSTRTLGTITVTGSNPYSVNLLSGVPGGTVTGRTPASPPTKTDGAVSLTTPQSADVTWDVNSGANKEWNGSFTYTATNCSGTGSGTVRLARP